MEQEQRKIRQKSFGKYSASAEHKEEDIETVIIIGKDGKDPVAEILADNPIKRKYTAVVTFGRFNPPHVGHLRLFKVVQETAKRLDADYYIIPSTVDYKERKTLVEMNRFPLTIDERIEFIHHLLPGSLEDDAVIDLRGTTMFNGKEIKSPYHIFDKLGELGYKKAIFILGHESGGGADKPTTSFKNLKKYHKGPSSASGMKVKPYFLHNEKVEGQLEGTVLGSHNMSARLIRNILMKDMNEDNFKDFKKAYAGSGIDDDILRKYYQKWHARLTYEIPAFQELQSSIAPTPKLSKRKSVKPPTPIPVAEEEVKSTLAKKTRSTNASAPRIGTRSSARIARPSINQ